MNQKFKHILVADDDPAARLLMQAALKKSGFAVSLADDGDDTLRRFRDQPADMVMLDVDMPGQDGYQVCAQLRQEVGNELPIVMVTGMDDQASIERAFDAGATDFITKPINWALLGHRVRYLFRAIRERKSAETALRKSEALLHQAQAVAHVGSWHMDVTNNILTWSPETYRMFGIPEGTPLTYERFLACIHPDDRQSVTHAWETALQGLPYSIEHRILVDGEVRWVMEHADLEQAEDGRLLSGIGTVQDITERKLQELEIIATRNKLQATLDAIPDLMFELDLDGRYLDYHSPRHDLLAAPPDQLIGRTISEILPHEAEAVCRAALQEAEQKGISTGRQFQLSLPQGSHWFELSISRKPEASSAKPHFIVLSRNITERKENESKVYRLAYYDTLTGLPNRLSFYERLERELKRADANNTQLAVLFMDMDGFKNVNDTLGHGTGDLILQWVADRLRQALRPADMVARIDIAEPDADLARLGGDEFTVLIPQLRHGENALTVAHRIHEHMRRPFALEGREVILTASIGIAVYPDDGTDPATLLKHADTAMYHAKDQGRDNCQFYSASLTREAMRRLDLESNLRIALERNEFFLVYQPQLDVASGRIRSLEALIRWQHPTQGLIPPLEFIPLAEENGLIVPIGDWVLRTACRDVARWQAAGQSLRVAVNLSAIQFRNPDLVSRIEAILAETHVSPEWLELEITEGILMEDSTATLATLNALRSVGMQLSLDDFGTGYSSLSYLKRLPLSNLKVDQSFTRGLPADRESLAIVRAIVALAKNLDFTVTAEGIETLEQAHILDDLECEMLQGYYIGKPVPAAEISELLERQSTLDEQLSMVPNIRRK